MALQIKQLVNHIQSAHQWFIIKLKKDIKWDATCINPGILLFFIIILNGEVKWKKCLSNLQNNNNWGIGNIPPERNEMKNNNQVDLRNTDILQVTE